MSKHNARLRRVRERLTPKGGPDGIDYSKPPSDDDLDYLAVIEGYARMRADMHTKNQSRGGVPIVPVNRAAAFYGNQYSQQEFRILAIHEGLTERGYDESEIDVRIPEYLEVLDDFLGGERDDEIGAVD